MLSLRCRTGFLLLVRLSCTLVDTVIPVLPAPFDVLLEVSAALGVELDENGAVWSDVGVLEEVRPHCVLVGFQLTRRWLRVLHSFSLRQVLHVPYTLSVHTTMHPCRISMRKHVGALEATHDEEKHPERGAFFLVD